MIKKIIIIEDDPGMQDAIRLVFDPAHYELTIFGNATDILEGQFEKPHLFIIDKQLSGVDGLDVCRYLKNNEDTKSIPVLMVSASPHIFVLAKTAGADCALAKPFKTKDLREKVEELITA